MIYSLIVCSAYLQLLYLRYHIFFLADKVNFIKNTCWKYPQLVMNILILSYHLAAASTRYPPIIWNLLNSDYLLISMILLYLLSHLLGFFAFIPLNSISLTWFDSLLIWFIFRFILVKTLTNTITFEFNSLAFPSSGRLNPLPNSSPNLSNDNRLLLLLLPLLNPSKEL